MDGLVVDTSGDQEVRWGQPCGLHKRRLVDSGGRARGWCRQRPGVSAGRTRGGTGKVSPGCELGVTLPGDTGRPSGLVSGKGAGAEYLPADSSGSDKESLPLGGSAEGWFQNR